MNLLKNIFHKFKPHFEKGGKYEKYYYLFEAIESFTFSPATVTGKKGAHVRDAINLKRLMMTVVIAMLPCTFFGMWNVGHQHTLATGFFLSEIEKFYLGVQIVLPIILVSYTAGGIVEVVFAIIRKHPINEGFLVTGLLIPLVMPPTVPLWQVALATIFAVVLAKEAFGGTGMNVVNVALVARAFLYFAYPSQLSGEVWTYLGDQQTVVGYSGATPLAIAATAVGNNQSLPVISLFDNTWIYNLYSLKNLFIGDIPGSIGETSTLMCLIGAFILIATGVGSWKIIASVFLGAYSMGLIFNGIGSNEFMLLPAHYHLVMGGLAFGAVFMATDPVTAAQTEIGKYFYGFFIGLFTVLIRVLNPAYPEGIMMAILLMNIFAPLIDYFVISIHKKRRLQHATV
ncbi:MAG: NADH:ubiquinone reductase (Na(+)-transporting) subunit B [Chitinophagaceae bacterium]|nr:NADH:ubiquinone reductase (Na(+)-transporting) subunit B [Chitinophagaceae bacterium]